MKKNTVIGNLLLFCAIGIASPCAFAETSDNISSSAVNSASGDLQNQTAPTSSGVSDTGTTATTAPTSAGVNETGTTATSTPAYPAGTGSAQEQTTASSESRITHHRLPEKNSFFVQFIVLLPLMIIFIILFIYVVRHYFFAINRLFGRQHNLYAEITEAPWPPVTLLVPAHNEEGVIADALTSIFALDYPSDKIQVIVINDRSTDRTGEIVERFVQQHPDRLMHFYRKEGTPGKAAALKDASQFVKNPITLIFDADYVLGPHLLKQLVTPFFDPEVGAVMGRVVPSNSGKNILTRLIDMERCGGYQVNQQARENLHGVVQYGGTAGGIRTSALQEVGGWDDRYLAEDTEITFRLMCQNWLAVYQNNAECLELVPETWPERIRQIKRWAKGHNQVLFKYFGRLFFRRRTSMFEKIDGVLLLNLFMISPILLLGWTLYLIAYFLNVVPGVTSLFVFLILISYSGIGNFTIFYEISTAIHLDNLRDVRSNRIRLLPLNYMNFFVSMFVISKAFLEQITVDRFKKGIHWDRTEHVSRTK